MDSLYRYITDFLDNGESGALCIIIGSRSSTPRHAGNKLLVCSGGHFVGTIGGVEVENGVLWLKS